MNGELRVPEERISGTQQVKRFKCCIYSRRSCHQREWWIKGTSMNGEWHYSTCKGSQWRPKSLRQAVKGNWRLSLNDPRFLNFYIPFLFNPYPLAPLQPNEKSNWSAGYPCYESRSEVCVYLAYNVRFFSWDLCIQIKRSFNDVFICDYNLKILVHNFFRICLMSVFA